MIKYTYLRKTASGGLSHGFQQQLAYSTSFHSVFDFNDGHRPLLFETAEKPFLLYSGDRKLGPWLTSMSAEASDMSGWMLMGLPGYAYLHGLSAFGPASALL